MDDKLPFHLRSSTYGIGYSQASFSSSSRVIRACGYTVLSVFECENDSMGVVKDSGGKGQSGIDSILRDEGKKINQSPKVPGFSCIGIRVSFAYHLLPINFEKRYSRDSSIVWYNNKTRREKVGE